MIRTWRNHRNSTGNDRRRRTQHYCPGGHRGDRAGNVREQYTFTVTFEGPWGQTAQTAITQGTVTQTQRGAHPLDRDSRLDHSGRRRCHRAYRPQRHDRRLCQSGHDPNPGLDRHGVERHVRHQLYAEQPVQRSVNVLSIAQGTTTQGTTAVATLGGDISDTSILVQTYTESTDTAGPTITAVETNACREPRPGRQSGAPWRDHRLCERCLTTWLSTDQQFQCPDRETQLEEWA